MVINKLGISGNTKLIAYWTRALRILMDHPTFIGIRKQSFFPNGVERRRGTSNSAWTNAVTSPPLWFHVMEFLEMKRRCSSTTEPCRKPRPEIRTGQFRTFKLHEVKDERCNCRSDTSMHPRITHPYEPNEPTSPVGRWCRPQPVIPLGGLETYHRIEQKLPRRK